MEGGSERGRKKGERLRLQGGGKWPTGGEGAEVWHGGGGETGRGGGEEARGVPPTPQTCDHDY
eukprot:2770675-Rhodomonas_salina.1